MRLLLDTHTFLWSAAEPETLPNGIRSLLQNAEHIVYLSVCSAWEIAIKHAKGRLDIPADPSIYVPARVSVMRYVPLEIRLEHAIRVSRLPDHHKDPFDRMLVAQAQTEQLAILTKDSAIARYDVEVIW